jgi:hypothetical protein
MVPSAGKLNMQSDLFRFRRNPTDDSARGILAAVRAGLNPRLAAIMDANRELFESVIHDELQFEPAIRNPQPSAEVMFNAVAASLNPRLAAIMATHRALFLAVIEEELEEEAPAIEAADLWTAGERTRANLKAMSIAATKRPDEMTRDDRAALLAYSGWGGLSIRDVADQFPAGFPVPEERGLIHEYYTPTYVTQEVARVIRPLVGRLPHTTDGTVLALEPSAGIGRFVNAASGAGFEALHWLVVEWSELSGRMLQAMHPDTDVYVGPFERWVRDRGPDYAGKIGLVLANPPYGKRGVSKTEDPDREYREKLAYHYFLRRGLDLLAPGGLGVFLIPAGFLSGQGIAMTALREKVLKRHHLMTAYRLPSKLFPGAILVTDLLFFQARGGELADVDEADRFILEGSYFDAFPTHILGVEVGKDTGDDDQTQKRGRFAYQVEGEFTGLPDLTERPMCAACAVKPLAPPRTKKVPRTGITRTEAPAVALPEYMAFAANLGLRVDRYLAAVAAQESDTPLLLWPELIAGLQGWAKSYGNPWD